jgi:hypothetical protein
MIIELNTFSELGLSSQGLAITRRIQIQDEIEQSIIQPFSFEAFQKTPEERAKLATIRSNGYLYQGNKCIG